MKINHLNQCAGFFSMAFLLASCSSNEIGQSEDVNQETIFQEYRLEYNEREKEASLFAQFRFAGENGTTLVLTNPSGVSYNGTVLKVDSNDFSGAFYSTAIPVKKLIGEHTFLFTDVDKRKYENHFRMDSFYVTDIPVSISRRAPALIKFRAPALYGEDYIELDSEGTDSSFSVKYTAGENGDYITIPASELQRQKSNEIFVIPTLYRKIKLQQQTKEGGGITTIQTLQPVKLRLVTETL